MDFTYSASGSVLTGDCSKYDYQYAHPHLFYIGDTVYVKPKALKGVLEKISIKEVRFPGSYDPTRGRMVRYDINIPLYVDTLNALFNEKELVTYVDALALIQDYRNRQDAWRVQNALKCIK
jgi:hypothetical protein